jgi:hypothetical protein
MSASQAITDVVMWARALTERMRRWHRGSGWPEIGLIPALADGPLLEGIQMAYLDFLTRTEGMRPLANYAAHHAALPYAGAAARLDPDWAVSLPVPDPPTGDVFCPELLTYDSKLTAGQYADDLLRAVDDFVTSLLDAFVIAT